MKTFYCSLAITTSIPAALSGATLSFGHVDAIGIGYDGAALEPHIHAEGATIDGIPDLEGEFAPDELVIAVPQSTRDYITTNGGRAAGSQWDPIGVGAGQSYWFLPQSSTLSVNLGTPFAGIAAEELVPADWNSVISVTLNSASLPLGGQFALGRTDTFGTPTFHMATLGGIDANDTIGITAGGHQHFNWYFTKPGTYDLTFDFAGTHAVDGPKTASATFTFHVIPEPSAGWLCLLGGGMLLRRRR